MISTESNERNNTEYQKVYVQGHNGRSRNLQTIDLKEEQFDQEVIASLPSMQQNYPNPVVDQTTIPLFVPLDVLTAEIQIAGINGQIITTISVEDRGQTEVRVQNINLSDGTYAYSLMVNGNRMATKTMLVTRM